MRSEPLTLMGLSEMAESGLMVPAPAEATASMMERAPSLPCSNSMPA